jgi:hypothetical protein
MYIFFSPLDVTTGGMIDDDTKWLATLGHSARTGMGNVDLHY